MPDHRPDPDASAPDWRQQLRDYAAEFRAKAERCTGGFRHNQLFLARFVEGFAEYGRPKDAERTLCEWFPHNPAFDRVSEILNAARGRRVVARIWAGPEPRWPRVLRWRLRPLLGRER